MLPEANATKCQKLIRLFCRSCCDTRATSVSSAKISVPQHNHATRYLCHYDAFKCGWETL